MRNLHSIAFTLLAVLSIAFCGCSKKDYSLAPVSGTITADGKPVDKLRVSFSPEPVGDNYSVGPYSTGVTNAEGKFTLITRHDETGAVPGKHKLSFQYSDISETAMADLREGLNDAKDSGSKEAVEKTKKKMSELKAKLKGRPVLKKCETVIDIPAGGHEDLKLELNDLMK